MLRCFHETQLACLRIEDSHPRHAWRYPQTRELFLDLSVAQTFQDDGINEGSPLRATVDIEDDDGENECLAICSSSLLSTLQVP